MFKVLCVVFSYIRFSYTTYSFVRNAASTVAYFISSEGRLTEREYVFVQISQHLIEEHTERKGWKGNLLLIFIKVFNCHPWHEENQRRS